mmetsp:Transcript_37690/g.70491  ORF Transcript_37690/g.70491 Transcript_37690/m.70491 type:complete len:301 (-) Transcript_37690:455-1357(-)
MNSSITAHGSSSGAWSCTTTLLHSVALDGRLPTSAAPRNPLPGARRDMGRIDGSDRGKKDQHCRFRCCLRALPLELTERFDAREALLLELTERFDARGCPSPEETSLAERLCGLTWIEQVLTCERSCTLIFTSLVVLLFFLFSFSFLFLGATGTRRAQNSMLAAKQQAETAIVKTIIKAVEGELFDCELWESPSSLAEALRLFALGWGVVTAPPSQRCPAARSRGEAHSKKLPCRNPSTEYSAVVWSIFKCFLPQKDLQPVAPTQTVSIAFFITFENLMTYVDFATLTRHLWAHGKNNFS